MGMDELHEQMRYFEQALIEFNDKLRVSMEDLRSKHEYVRPLWQDEMQRTFDSQWNPLDEMMGYYAMREGPAYVEFIEIKLHRLQRYLYG